MEVHQQRFSEFFERKKKSRVGTMSEKKLAIVKKVSTRKQELSFDDIWMLVQGGTVVKDGIELKLSIVRDPDLHAHIDTLKSGARRIRLVKKAS